MTSREFFDWPTRSLDAVEPTAADRGVFANVRALGLLIVRESDEWDLELFNAMREQTYQNLREMPEVEAVRQAGLSPLRASQFTVLWGPDGVREEVVVEERRQGRTKAYLFFYRGYWHLWCQASAHKVDGGDAEERLNAFTTIAIDVIREVRPKALYAANLSRLVRNTAQGNRLWAALEGNVDELWVKEMKFELTGPSAQMSFMLLSMLGWVASLERDAIVTRLLTGRIAKWRRGEWAHGASTIPFGYKLEDKRLVPDLTLKPAVRDMMLILCTPAPPSEKVRQLDAIGVTMMRTDRRLKRRRSIAATSSPDAAIRILMSWAPLWISGEYLWRVSNSFAGMEELAGVPIVRHEVQPGGHRDLGELQMLYRVPTPAGGWAEPEVLDCFAQAAIDNSQRLLDQGCVANRPVDDSIVKASTRPRLLQMTLSGDHANQRDRQTAARRDAARAKATISAFAGRGWRDGNFYYELKVVGSKAYRLVRWSLDPDETVDGNRWSGLGEGGPR